MVCRAYSSKSAPSSIECKPNQPVFYADVPEFLFFSRTTLFQGLLAALNIHHLDVNNVCSFRQFCNERSLKSHTHSAVEESLVENEIGGVILGSLSAGIKQRPLNREEYLEEKRSNIPNKLERDRKTRHEVFTEFEKYQNWKLSHKSHDIDDTVLMILQSSSLAQIFDATYVDEVQDFSYASLLLICKIGGAHGLKWIFAGDTG